MKTKLIFLLWFISIEIFSQLPAVPNTETFSLSDVVAAVLPNGAGQVDTFTKSGYAENAIVTINGHAETMTWNTDEATTVSNFVVNYGTNFTDVTLANSGGGVFTATSNILGEAFASTSTITGTGNSVSTTTAASYSSTLQDCFDDADNTLFDDWYFAYYSTGHLIFNQKQFRNYGGTQSGIPIPEAIGATNIAKTAFQANWNSSSGATGYYIDVSPNPYFSSFLSGYNNYYVGNFTGISVSGATANTFYYYRIRANTVGGYSDNSNTQIVRTATVWFLPSLSELSAMYNYVANLDADYYWSSSEYYAAQAYELTGTDGTYQGIYKTTTDHVRAARMFVSAHVYTLGDAGYTGTIFHMVDNGGGTYTYYESTPSDQSTDYAWSNITGTSVTGTGTAIGTGITNTQLIINQGGHTSSAAKLCNDLVLN